VAALQADMDTLRRRLDDLHDSNRAAVDQLRSTTRQQLDAQAVEQDELLQVGTQRRVLRNHRASLGSGNPLPLRRMPPRVC
jgi:hypothetical protein